MNCACTIFTVDDVFFDFSDVVRYIVQCGQLHLFTQFSFQTLEQSIGKDGSICKCIICGSLQIVKVSLSLLGMNRSGGELPIG